MHATKSRNKKTLLFQHSRLDPMPDLLKGAAAEAKKSWDHSTLHKPKERGHYCTNYSNMRVFMQKCRFRDAPDFPAGYPVHPYRYE
jgi:hypothetical protein